MPRGARLLGAPRVWQGGRWHDLPLDKRLGLLTYLACAGAWVTRERLSYLFWPDVPTSRARINLRRLLARARSLPLAEALDADAVRIRWNVHSDVHEFRRALSEEDWRAATSAYAGDLAEGLEVDDTSEFANWLGFERTQLRESYRRAAMRLAEQAVSEGRPEEAAAAYDRLLGLDPLDEAVVQARMRLHVSSGALEEARRVFRSFASRLADELGLEPAAATEAILRERPSQEDVAGPPDESASFGPSAAPREPLTSFVGREEELRFVEERLAGGECRLLTVVGPGGVGKTRLAIRAAASLAPRFADGAVLVSLGGVSAPDAIPVAIASAAGVRLRGTDAPLVQVAAALRDRHALLLLDDFDHLVESALIVDELLAACPRLRCLVTSRQRLRLQGEWLLPLSGLPVPPAGVTEPEAALAYGAVRLLADRARQVSPTFDLRRAGLDTVTELCRLLDGLPLGLELAAASLRTLALSEVLDAIRADVRALETDAQDVPSRHRSLGAAFEHSWRLLTEGERRVYRRLSAFEGEFGEVAAQDVAGATRPALGALMEKSLLRPAGRGRYSLHPLLRELVLSRLVEDPAEALAILDAHSRHHLRRLARWTDRLHGPEQAQMLEELTPDYQDIVAAWLHGVRRGWYSDCRATGSVLLLFHGIQGRFHEGAATFERALALLDDASVGHPSVLLGHLLVHLAWLLATLGRFDEAVALAERAAEITAAQGDTLTELLCWQVRGTVASRRGDDANAILWLTRGLELAEASGDVWSISLLSGNLGLAELRAGMPEDAERHFKKSLEHNEALGNAAGIVNDLDYLGRLDVTRGEYESAARRFERGLELAERARFRQRVPYLELQLSTVARARGDAAGAQRHATRALNVAAELGQRAVQAEARLALGRLAAEAGGGTGEAEDHLLTALEVSWSLGELPLVLAAVLELAGLLPRGEQGLDLVALVAAHPATRQEQRAQARELLGRHRHEGRPLPSLDEAVGALLCRGSRPAGPSGSGG